MQNGVRVNIFLYPEYKITSLEDREPEKWDCVNHRPFFYALLCTEILLYIKKNKQPSMKIFSF